MNGTHMPPEIGIAIIGGGIVGLSLARSLADEGLEVVVIDDGRMSGSIANAGSLHVQMQSRFIRYEVDEGGAERESEG